MEGSNIEKLKELVSRSRVGMLGTLVDNVMRFRPMSHVDIDDDGNLWYFTSQDSWKADSIKNNPNVYLTYANESDSTYVSIVGFAQLLVDRERMKELFNPFVKAWFPKGLKDSSLALLMVHPLEIDYWVNDASKVLTYIKILSASMMGTQPNIGEHGKLSLK